MAVPWRPTRWVGSRELKPVGNDEGSVTKSSMSGWNKNPAPQRLKAQALALPEASTLSLWVSEK